MKKAYRLEDLDCANCAAKMEDAIRRIDGVVSVSVSFMTQRMTLETRDDVSHEDVLAKAVKACKRVEPDCRIIL